MALVISTDLIESHSRVDALTSAMSKTEVPIDVTVSGSPHQVWHRLEAWELGTGFHVLRNVGTAFRIRRGPTQLRVSAPERFAIAIQMGSQARYESIAGLQLLDTNDMQLVDQTSQMDYSLSKIGGSTAAVFDYESIGIPVDIARKAITTLRRSPLYDLVRNDLSRLCETLDGLESGPTVDLVAGAMKRLVAAMVVTAAADNSQQAADALEDTIVSRVKAYVDEHLADPMLTLGELAAAHGITVRHLHRIWPEDETSIQSYITDRRLVRAESEIRKLSTGRRDIDQLARECGFASAPEFDAEFRNKHGAHPSEWQSIGSVFNAGS